MADILDKDFKTTVKDTQNYRMMWKKVRKDFINKMEMSIKSETTYKVNKNHSRAENYNNCNEKSH